MLSTITKNTAEMLGSISFVLIRPFQTTQQCPKTGRMQCCFKGKRPLMKKKSKIFPFSLRLRVYLKHFEKLYVLPQCLPCGLSRGLLRGLLLWLLLCLLRCLIHALPYGLPRDYLGLHRCSWIINSVYLPFLFRKFRDFGWTDYV